MLLGGSVYPEEWSVLMRWISILACSIGVTAMFGAGADAALGQGATHLMLPPVPKALLPEAFAGWVAAEAPKSLPMQPRPTRPTQRPSRSTTLPTAHWPATSASGETLSLRALRFHDASGAYGAYTFYRQNGWPKEEIGVGRNLKPQPRALLAGQHRGGRKFLSHRPHVRRRSCASWPASCPFPKGTGRSCRRFWLFCPRQSLDGQTTHYAVGPASYAGAGGVLPLELVGFDRGAETVTANYSLRSGPATLTIIDYPTPQMAMAQETKIRDYIK